MKWRFSVYHLNETWVSQNLGNVINRYYRKWLDFLVSGNITHLSLPKNKLGLNIKTLKQIYFECKVSVLQTLKLSCNKEVRTLYQLTNNKNVNTNCLINSIDIAEKHLRNKMKSVLSKATKETIWNEFLDSKEQCSIIKFLVNTIPTNHLVQRQKVMSSLPNNTVNFAQHYIIYSLSNGTNLQKWKQKETSDCQLCQNKETQQHLFNHCTAALKGYEWKHNCIIQTIMNNLVTITSDTCRLYADTNGYKCPSTLLKSKRPNETNAEMYLLRPDIIIRKRNFITVTELMCPFEINLLKSHDYKFAKYQNFCSALLNPCSHLKLILLKISLLGFTGSSIKTFETSLNGINLDSVRIIKKCPEMAICVLYYIYWRCNKIWSDPELLPYT